MKKNYFQILFLGISMSLFSQGETMGIGASVTTFNTFYQAELGKGGTEGSRFFFGMPLSGLRFWYEFDILDSLQLRTDLGINTTLVPTYHPMIGPDGNPVSSGITMDYVWNGSTKLFFKSGVNINLGMGLGAMRFLTKDTSWDALGVESNQDYGSWDLIIPVEFEYGILKVQWIPTFMRWKTTGYEWSYAQVTTVELGGTYRF